MEFYFANRCGVSETLEIETLGLYDPNDVVLDENTGICYEIQLSGGTGIDVTITNEFEVNACGAPGCRNVQIKQCDSPFTVYDVVIPTNNNYSSGDLIVWNNQCFEFYSTGGTGTYPLAFGAWVPQSQLAGLTCNDEYSACTPMLTYTISGCSCGVGTYTVNLPNSPVTGDFFEYNGRCYTVVSATTFNFSAKFLDIQTYTPGGCTNCIIELPCTDSFIVEQCNTGFLFLSPVSGTVGDYFRTTQYYCYQYITQDPTIFYNDGGLVGSYYQPIQDCLDCLPLPSQYGISCCPPYVYYSSSTLTFLIDKVYQVNNGSPVFCFKGYDGIPPSPAIDLDTQYPNTSYTYYTQGYEVCEGPGDPAGDPSPQNCPQCVQTTPTPTPCPCYYWDVNISQIDLDNAIGNTIYLDNTIYVSNKICGDIGNTETNTYDTAGNYLNAFCNPIGTTPQIYYYENDLPIILVNSTITSTNNCCASQIPTPTPTPTTPPCVSYTAISSGGGPGTVFYTDCDGNPQDFPIENEVISFCAIEGTVSATPGISIIDNGPCTPTPTPTPTPTQTPEPTPTPTSTTIPIEPTPTPTSTTVVPTPTPTSTTVVPTPTPTDLPCDCHRGLIIDADNYSYFDCNGNLETGSGSQGVFICYDINKPFSINILDAGIDENCVCGQQPTPTPTPTPAPVVICWEADNSEGLDECLVTYLDCELQDNTTITVLPGQIVTFCSELLVSDPCNICHPTGKNCTNCVCDVDPTPTPTPTPGSILILKVEASLEIDEAGIVLRRNGSIT